MSFCYNCGVRRSPVDTVCEKCGIRFDDREQVTPAPSEWGSLILDHPPVQNATDNQKVDSEETRFEEACDKESGPIQPPAKVKTEEPPTSHRDTSRNSDQESQPEHAYYSGRMLDDVLSDFRSSEAEIELALELLGILLRHRSGTLLFKVVVVAFIRVRIRKRRMLISLMILTTYTILFRKD